MAATLLRRNALFKSLRQNIFLKRNSGYLVLIPEIGEDFSENNTLVGKDGLPEFNELTIDKCIGLIGRQALEYESGIKNLEANCATCKDVFKEVFEPLESMDTNLELIWGVAKTMYLSTSSRMPTKSYMSIHDRAHRARSSKFHSLPIYKAVLEEKEKHKNLSDEKERLLDKYALEGKLNGLEVEGVKRNRLNNILNTLRQERANFREKVNIATNNFVYPIRGGELVREFPESLLKAMANDSNEAGKGPWKVSLQPHIYTPFMEHCPDKLVRWNAWQAHVSRCSGYADKTLETSTHLEQIRSHRQEQAKILGFETFADMSMETKMAGSVENVYNTLSSMTLRARPAQEDELKSLQTFASERGFDGKLEQCDIAYWQRKQKKSLYNYDEEKIRDYFPLPKVVASLFNLCSNLFNIQIVEHPNIQTWHKDVKYYDIFEPSSTSPVAGFYFDPYAREDEKIRIYDDSGWNVTIRNKSTITNATPITALIFNFQVPLYGKQSLLSFNEVQMLFHKFGQSLRNLLTQTNYSDVAGTSNVEWDAAEVCGHVMTHWLYDPETIQSISAHYTTEEPLPSNIIDNLHSVRSHMAGFTLCKELYLSHLDLELHSKTDFWRDIVRKLWPVYNVLQFEKNDAHPCNFTRIFSEEWGAAYFCHLWSRMIAADVYSAFEEAKNDSQDVLAVGKRYRETFLALGGGCRPNEVFRRFRGRDPCQEALLHNLRLKKPIIKEVVNE